LLALGLWFSPGTLASRSSTTKTDCHDIAEILLKVALKYKKIKYIILYAVLYTEERLYAVLYTEERLYAVLYTEERLYAVLYTEERLYAVLYTEERLLYIYVYILSFFFFFYKLPLFL
jgi:hypothetical protein